MQVKKQHLELDMEQQTGSKSGKEYIKAIYCHPAHLTYMQSTPCKMLGWMRHKLELRLPGEIINNLRYADDTTLMAESEEELKSLLMNVKEESLKACLIFNIQKMKIMASSPITSWKLDGKTMETVTVFIFFLAPKSLQMVTAAMKLRCLFFERKAMTNLDSILKSRDSTLPTKVCLVKAMVYPVVHGCETWTIKKAER